MDDATKLEIETLVAQAVEAAVAPLRLEVEELKARFGMQATSETRAATPDAAPNARGDAAPNPRGDAAPNERSDFARFIQRGLEQEARAAQEQTEEEIPVPKRGWNPFKR